jgi:hypothetical protein
MFTTRKEEAPKYKLGTIKCFLHPESADRVLLDEIGLSGASCPAAGLSSLYSKRMHGLHRHKEEWDAYQEFLTDKKEADAIAEQRAQTAAMLALGEKAAGVAPEDESCPVEGCEYTGTVNQVRGHKVGAHK